MNFDIKNPTTVEHFKKVATTFRLPGNLIKIEPITIGNINQTFRVYFDNDKSYIFQCVNRVVFTKPVEVVNNIDAVTTYMREKFPTILSPHYHHTTTQKNYGIIEGQFWRVLKFIDADCLSSADNLDDVRNVGLAFGNFQLYLKDFDASVLYETIKDFHNTSARFDKLFADCKDIKTDELDFFMDVRAKATIISEKFNKKELPLRVVHNDTKSNNVLLDRKTHAPLSVIDLDTVMPGCGLNDFGDGARFICCTTAEDEVDTSKVDFDLDKFRAYSEGFLTPLKDVWTKEEKELIVTSVFALTCELASRFYDDYVLGSPYFKINYPRHNLDRARCQIALAKAILSKWDKMEAIIDEVLK